MYITPHVYLFWQRSRLLATLYKDERSVRLPNFAMLEKMFMDRLLQSEANFHTRPIC